MSFLLSLFLLSGFPACWASCHFPCTGLSSHWAFTTGAFAKLDFCCTWLPPRGGQAEIVSARLNLRNSTMDVMGVCDFLGSVSLQQKLEAIDRPVLWFHVITQFYLEINGKCNLEAWGPIYPKDVKRREALDSILAPVLICFLSSPEPALCKLSQPGGLFASLEVLTLVLGPSFVLYL